MSKKVRSAAQKAATKRMLQARWGTRKTNPAKRAKKRRSTSLASVKRHGSPVSVKTWKSSGYARNPIKRRRRNPIGRLNLGGIVGNTIVPAATAATGAIALDIAYNFIPLPENLKSGPLRHVVKAAGAIGLGIVAGMVVKKETAKQLAAGAMTVVMYNAFREVLTRFAPNLGLGAYLDEGSSEDGISAYLDGAYDEATTSIGMDGAYDLSGTYDLSAATDGEFTEY